MATALLLGIFIAIQILIAANINQIRKIIMANTQDELSAIAGISAKLTKIGGETSKLVELVAALQQAANNNGNVPDEVMNALNAVANQANVVDDLVPDATELLPPAPTPDPAPNGAAGAAADAS